MEVSPGLSLTLQPTGRKIEVRIMSMVVAHMQKMKSENLHGLQRHNDRKNENYSNELIDKSRSHLNYELTNHNQSSAYHDEVMQRINEERTSKRAVRKDAVLVNSWIISADKEFFDSGANDMIIDPVDGSIILGKDFEKRYFEIAYDFFAERYGAEHIAYATVHLDESTPHLHLGVIPLRNGVLSSKTMFNREELRNIQDELTNHLQNHGFSIDRGLSGTPRKHLDTPDFKRLKSEEKAAQRAAENELNSLKSELIENIASIDPEFRVSRSLFDEHQNHAIFSDEEDFHEFSKKYGVQPEPFKTPQGKLQGLWLSITELSLQLKNKMAEQLDKVREQNITIDKLFTNVRKAFQKIAVKLNDDQLLTDIIEIQNPLDRGDSYTNQNGVKWEPQKIRDEFSEYWAADMLGDAVDNFKKQQNTMLADLAITLGVHQSWRSTMIEKGGMIGHSSQGHDINKPFSVLIPERIQLATQAQLQAATKQASSYNQQNRGRSL